MARIAYFDCFSGCSGDMVLGALLDAGLPLETLEKSLGLLGVAGYRLAAEKVKRASVTATKFNVVLDENIARHGRSLADVEKMIESSGLPETVRRQSLALFRRLGVVEGRVHGISPEQVHLHELGAIDSIVDIVGAVLAFEALKIERFYSSPLPLGSGTVAAEHGILPLPAPATLELVAMANAPVVGLPDESPARGELVTPTGALLVTSLASFSRPGMIVEKVGYGAGSRDMGDWPNVLRIWLGREAAGADSESLVLLETNIDDMNPQVYGYLMEKLFAEQAADVWFTPIQMKKNRPAVMLSVLAPAPAECRLTETIMRETSTLGVRTRQVSRHIAGREIFEFESSLGHVRVKVKRFESSVVVSPEYEDCRRIALEKGLPFREVYRIIEAESRRHVNG